MQEKSLTRRCVWPVTALIQELAEGKLGEIVAGCDRVHAVMMMSAAAARPGGGPGVGRQASGIDSSEAVSMAFIRRLRAVNLTCKFRPLRRRRIVAAHNIREIEKAVERDCKASRIGFRSPVRAVQKVVSAVQAAFPGVCFK